jgi:hypothetical protein
MMNQPSTRPTLSYLSLPEQARLLQLLEKLPPETDDMTVQRLRIALRRVFLDNQEALEHRAFWPFSTDRR